MCIYLFTHSRLCLLRNVKIWFFVSYAEILFFVYLYLIDYSHFFSPLKYITRLTYEPDCFCFLRCWRVKTFQKLLLIFFLFRNEHICCAQMMKLIIWAKYLKNLSKLATKKWLKFLSFWKLLVNCMLLVKFQTQNNYYSFFYEKKRHWTVTKDFCLAIFSVTFSFGKKHFKSTIIDFLPLILSLWTVLRVI